MTLEGRTAKRLNAGALPAAGDVSDLIEHCADIAVHIGPDDVVLGVSVQPDAPTLGCLDHWVGRRFQDFLTIECVPKYDERAAALRAGGPGHPRPLELNHVDQDKPWDAPLRYSVHAAGGDGSVLLLGHDMLPVAELQEKLLREQQARERDHQRVRGIETYYRVVLKTSDTPLVLIEAETGRLRDLNLAAAEVLGGKPEALAGSSFAQAFDGRRTGELMEALRGAVSADGPGFTEAVARRGGEVVTLYPEFFRASGELAAICRLSTTGARNDTQPELGRTLGALYSATSDAIVLLDARGTITESNEAFLVMTDAPEVLSVQGRSMGDFLTRGAVDLKLMLDATVKMGRLRSFSTHLASLVGTRLPVDISAVRMFDGGRDTGFGVIIREVQPSSDFAPVSEAPPSVVSEEAMKSVMHLVGTASLRELVSATSDVVEKMCIETAVKLTGNNRMAAAEMLGLSRQSLYVKLRKHGILEPSSDE